jgi:hypothetical protein
VTANTVRGAIFGYVCAGLVMLTVGSISPLGLVVGSMFGGFVGLMRRAEVVVIERAR